MLYFYTVTVEYSIGCRKDNIRIYDGDDTAAPLISTLCGTLTHRRVMLRHNEAFVAFSSDGSKRDTEIEVDYVAITPVEGKKNRRASFYSGYNVVALNSQLKFEN